MEHKALKRKHGPFVEIFPLFDLSTIQHAHELMAARKTDISLLYYEFWTADFPMYRLEGERAVLYFAPREYNLIFRDVQNAISQLRREENYFPKKEWVDEVTDASKTGVVLRTELSNLRLKRSQWEELSYFEIDRTNTNFLNPAERSLAERIFGQGDQFEPNINVPSKDYPEYDSKTLDIFLLDPSYIKRLLEDNKKVAIGRLSFINCHPRHPFYWATNNEVSGHLPNFMYGALKKST